MRDAMQDFIAVEGHGARARLAAHPVTRGAYRDYLEATDQPLPESLGHGEPLSAPITCVSQVDALEYLRWLGSRDGQPYRLPAMGELHELAAEALADGISRELWPHVHGQRPEVRGGLKEIFLCEWTGETEEIAQPGGRPPRRLASIFYPPWLREGSNATHAQAHLLATEGYSFVTFRAAVGL